MYSRAGKKCKIVETHMGLWELGVILGQVERESIIAVYQYLFIKTWVILRLHLEGRFNVGQREEVMSSPGQVRGS